MSVLSHFNEFKRRMVRVAIVAVVFCGIALAFYAQIFDVFTVNVEWLVGEAGGIVTV